MSVRVRSGSLIPWAERAASLCLPRITTGRLAALQALKRAALIFNGFSGNGFFMNIKKSSINGVEYGLCVIQRVWLEVWKQGGDGWGEGVLREAADCYLSRGRVPNCSVDGIGWFGGSGVILAEGIGGHAVCRLFKRLPKEKFVKGCGVFAGFDGDGGDGGGEEELPIGALNRNG